MKKLVVIRGGGELATGIAHRLHNSGYRVLMLEKESPSAIRRSIVFAEAVYDGTKIVERVECYLAKNVKEAEPLLKDGKVIIMVDPECKCLEELKPKVLVDAIYAKRNMGTTMDMAPLTIGIGPGFAAGRDVHAVIETSRGHNLGRIIRSGQAMPEKEAADARAIMRSSHPIIAPFDGTLVRGHALGLIVKEGEPIVTLMSEDDENRKMLITSPMEGVLRGLLHDGCPVKAGLKIAEIDPSTRPDNCYTISAKSRCVSGSVLEEIMAWEKVNTNKKSRFSFLSRGDE